MNLLESITVETGLRAPDAERIIASAPKRYKQYSIPKRDGGLRIIAQPSRELKLLQRLLTDQWLKSLPVHRCATAYVRKKNILENARLHQGSGAILKLDFENFFPSLRVADWKRFVEDKRCPWDGQGDLARVSNILFWGQGNSRPHCLSIGAPSSPIVSNLLMFGLDEQFSKRASELEVIYTRYADDITASAATIEQTVEFEKYVRATLKSCRSPKLRVNEKKRGIYSRGQRRMVTGLILTPVGDVSIGRERKREISTLLHLFRVGRLDINQVGYLKGMLGFSIANEPDFLGRLRRKYGDVVVDRVLDIRLPRRRDR